MLRLLSTFCICLMTFPAFCQSTPKYQVGTITEVKLHESAGKFSADAASYDITVKVGDMIYVVLYTTPVGDVAPKYAAGRQLLVLVRKSTITCNDLLGRSLQLPIESQERAGTPSEPKQSQRGAQ